MLDTINNTDKTTYAILRQPVTLHFWVKSADIVMKLVWNRFWYLFNIKYYLCIPEGEVRG